MSYRIDKVENLIKEEISLIFLHKLQDPELGFVTITNVKVSPDLRNAKIYISILDKENRESAFEKVNELKGYIKGLLSQRINKLKYMPDLTFFIDDTIDYVEKMEKLFKKIHEDDNPRNKGSK